MKDFEGTPGTKTGLFLRLVQCFSAAASISYFITAPTEFLNFAAFCVLIFSMGVQVAWSSGLAFLDAYSLVKNKPLQSHSLISFFVVGDLVTAMLSLAGASSSAGVTIYFSHDWGICNMGVMCQNHINSVALAFLSWISVALSSLIMVWISAAQ